MLGALYAALGAFTFALNNATLRRGVLTGTVMQAMAITVPVGGAGFLALAIAAGALPHCSRFRRLPQPGWPGRASCIS